MTRFRNSINVVLRNRVEYFVPGNLKNSKMKIINFLFKLLFGKYENEPTVNTFENLSKFTKKYGEYELVELILPDHTTLMKVAELTRKAEQFPEDNKVRELLDVVLELLESPAFVDSLELKCNAVEQRVRRVEVKALLGHWAKDTGKHGKKLNPRLRKKYSNMLALWDINRMRRSNNASLTTNLMVLATIDNIYLSPEVFNLQMDLMKDAFDPAGNSRPGCLYDYMSDQQKIVIKHRTDELFILFAEDLVAHLTPEESEMFAAIAE